MPADTLAVLLAAGTGSRLRPLTDRQPKCLLEVGGRPLLDYPLAALAAHGVRDVLAVTGHCAAQVARRYAGKLRTLVHPDYASTNNLHSLWAARREFAGRDLLVLHADLLFDPAILGPCLASQHEATLVLDPALLEETMKARVENDNAVEVGKNIPADKQFGTFLGIARFRPRASALLADVLASLARDDSNRQAYFTASLPLLAARGCPAGYSLTNGRAWIEIDSPADLSRAQNEILKSLAGAYQNLWQKLP